jgi:hypothetical protein
MKGLGVAAGILLVVVLLSAGGCYTVLRHPTGSDITYQGSYGRSCADCHAGAEFYHPYYSYGRSNYYWNDYYGHPWWYNDYWWWDHHDGGNDGEAPDVEQGERHLWSPGGWASGGWGFVKPGGGTSTPDRTSPPKSTGVDDSKESPSNGSNADDSKDSDKDDKDDDRNLWKGNKKKGF